MLLDTDTALKVAHDIIHDASEFIGPWNPDTKTRDPGKWANLVAPSTEVPDGFVDFELSNGQLLRVPCAWQIMLDESADRTRIVLKRDGIAVSLRPDAITPFKGLRSDNDIILNRVYTNAISGIPVGEEAPTYIENARLAALNATAITANQCIIEKLLTTAFTAIVHAAFENLSFSDGAYIDGTLDSLEGDAIDTKDLNCTDEIVRPVLKMNTWSVLADVPATDAAYTGHIPLLPLNEKAGPINGFNNSLTDNPFFPDWLYANNRPGVWKPQYAWVPSFTRPAAPAWLDSDGIYWYLVSVSTPDSAYGQANVIFPPRCKEEGSSNYVVAPLTADADGLVVAVRHLGSSPISYVTTDRYEYVDDNTWQWHPGRTIRLDGPALRQFVIKRQFSVSGRKIVAVEYQFLPLGEVNVID